MLLGHHADGTTRGVSRLLGDISTLSIDCAKDGGRARLESLGLGGGSMAVYRMFANRDQTGVVALHDDPLDSQV